ncbi:cbb3-type cytochrome c oxidase subunit I, partial [bacterium]|nr:cbb3-type cytochrome c oxidase subunit I [bacterium]
MPVTTEQPAGLRRPNYLFAKGRYPGILGWLLTTDHKRIGLLYLGSILSAFMLGATLGVLMRLELIWPGKTIMEAKTYNAVFTLHGVVMI